MEVAKESVCWQGHDGIHKLLLGQLQYMHKLDKGPAIIIP